MRISDWSSDGCPSDLIAQLDDQRAGRNREAAEQDTANPAGGGLTGQVRTTRIGHVGHRSCLLSLAAPDALSGAGPPLACQCSGEEIGLRCAEHKCRLFRLTMQPEHRSEEHTSELQSLMRISYAVFCLKKKKTTQKNTSSLTYIT